MIWVSWLNFWMGLGFKMPFCGFNRKMLEGLAAFNEGLVEHGIINRSKKKGQTTDETLSKELGDMDRFLAETRGLKDPQIRNATENLARYAMAFYRIVESRGIENYQETVKALGSFYAEMDRKYYSDLEGKGKPDDMKELVKFLNGKEI